MPEEVIRAHQTYQANIIECDVTEITSAMVRTCDSLGVRIMAYARSNTAAEFAAVLRSPADLVNLDRPSLYLEVRRDH